LDTFGDAPTVVCVQCFVVDDGFTPACDVDDEVVAAFFACPGDVCVAVGWLDVAGAAASFFAWPGGVAF
jgi:hypothetical protein